MNQSKKKDKLEPDKERRQTPGNGGVVQLGKPAPWRLFRYSKASRLRSDTHAGGEGRGGDGRREGREGEGRLGREGKGRVGRVGRGGEGCDER